MDPEKEDAADMSVAEINFPTSDARERLFSRLGKFRRRVRTRLFFEGAAIVLAGGFLLALATVFIDHTFRLSVAARICLLIAATVALALLIWHNLIKPALLKLDSLTLATALDRSGQLTARLASVVELPTLLQSNAPPSPAMVQHALARCHESLAAYDFQQRFDDRRRDISLATIAGAILIPILIALLAPATTKLWAARLFAASNTPWPQNTYLQITNLQDNTLVVPRGEPFVLRVTAKPNTVVPDLVTLRFREEGASRTTANFTVFAANDFRYDFAAINSPVTVEVWGGDDVLSPFTIRPAERPRVVDLKLVAQHPWQAQPQSYSFSGSDSDLSFLPQTKMHLSFTANTPIAQAKLISSTTRPAQVDLIQLDDEHFAIDWLHHQPVQLQLELIGRDAHLESPPTDVSIGLKTDQPPRITLTFTGVHQRVAPQARIPLNIDARDDYGVAQVSMSTKIERPDPNNPAKLVAETTDQVLFGPASPASELELQQSQTVALAPYKLAPGSLVTLSASAQDACYTGAQTTKTRPITFRIVPPEELFREILLRQQAERARFRKQADEARSIREAMTTLSTAADVAQLAHRHRAIQREITGITTALNDSVTEMRLNSLATDEAYTLIQKNVLAPLKSLNDDYMNPQKTALDGLQPDDSKALAAIEDRQDKMIAQMEEILKQMSQWDSFVDVLNQLNEIIRMQDQAQQQTNQMKKKQTDSVFEH
jgi:hypothetical protein